MSATGCRDGVFRPGLAGWWRRAVDSDLCWSFSRSPAALLSAALIACCLLIVALAPALAPTDPFDLAGVDLIDAHLPPLWTDGGDPRFLLGTDDQGRDLVSVIIYGLRLSLVIGLSSVALSILLGIGLGLLAGFSGGWLDTALMRICDVTLSFPAILVALLLNGIFRSVFAGPLPDWLAYFVLIFAITLSGWVPYARTVRGMTMVEREKEYVLAATLIGQKRFRILLSHIMPNVLSPVFVLATVNVATAVMTEATLSFLGVGVPPTTPSLGTLIRIGNDYLFSGEWWVCLFPGLVLVILVLAVNLLGDWLREALNPRLR